MKLNKTGSVRLISNGKVRVTGGTAEDRARSFLAQHGGIFGVPADLSGLQLVDRVTSGTGDHVTFLQTYQGIPVEGAHVVVHLSRDGTVFQVNSTLVPELDPKMSPVVPKEEAVARANAYLKRRAKGSDRPLVSWAIWATPELQTRAWIVHFTPGDVPGFWRFVVDATSGALIRAENNVHGLDGTGTVYSFSPIKTLDDDPRTPFSSASSPRQYDDFNDSGDSDIFTGNGTDVRVYRPGAITGVIPDAGNAFTSLAGPTCRITGSSNISTVGAGPCSSPADNFCAGDVNGNNFRLNFTRDDIRFEAVNVYFWITTLHKYALDTTGINLRVRQPDNRNLFTFQVEANPHETATFPANDPSGLCLPTVSPTRCYQNTSFYDYNRPALHYLIGGVTFPGGATDTSGVDQGEDTDVVLHEYGHAIQDGQIPGGCCSGGASTDSRAMGEGFGDYQAAMFAQVLGRAGRDPATFGAWSNAPPQATAGGPLRRLDGTRNIDVDSGDTSPLTRGQIWSAALWDIKNRVGARIANRAIYEHLLLRTGETDDMAAAAEAVLTAHEVMDFGINRDAIRAVFVQRGILDPIGDGTPPSLTAARTIGTKTILLTFDEPLNQASINQERVENGVPGVIPAACSNQVGNFQVAGHTINTVGQSAPNVVAITLNTTLSTGERPRVTVLEVADVAGNRAFCVDTNSLVSGTFTGTLDTTPPRIQSVTKVLPATLRIRFTEAMDTTTFLPDRFAISGLFRSATSATMVDAQTMELVISPALRPNERVMLRVRNPLSDANGVLLQPGSAPFVTAP